MHSKPKQKPIEDAPVPELLFEMKFFADPFDLIPEVPRFFESRKYRRAPEFETYLTQMQTGIRIQDNHGVRAIPPLQSRTFTLPIPRNDDGEEYESLERILSPMDSKSGLGVQSREIKIETESIWRWLQGI